MVSISPFQLKICIGMGLKKLSKIASSSIPATLPLRQRSLRYADRVKRVSISPSRKSRNGAVGLTLRYFEEKTLFVNFPCVPKQHFHPWLEVESQWL